jgi:sulfate permease, SulP family
MRKARNGDRWDAAAVELAEQKRDRSIEGQDVTQISERMGSPQGVLSTIAPIGAGAIAGVLAAFYATSFALIVFSGPMAVALEAGARLALTGTVVLCLVAALRRPYAGVLWQPQSIPVIVIGKGLAVLALGLGEADTATLAATGLAFVGVSAVLTGIVLLAIGIAKVAQIARSVPYPVIGGFMAATGVYLLLNAAGIAAGNEALSNGLLGSTAVQRWMPPVAIGAALMMILRFSRLRIVLPLGILLYLLTFHGWAAGQPGGLAAARDAGLLVVGVTLADTGPELSAALLGQIDWGAIATQLPLMLTVAGLTLLGALLNLSAIEQATGRAQDMNRELRTVGFANVLTGGIGGFVGYPATSISLLAERLSGSQSRIVAIFAAMGAASIAFGGMHLLGYMPRGLFAMILAFIGTDFLMTWLWEGARRMPRKDYAIVLLIMLSALAFGFIAAVALGVITAAISFTVSYSKIDAIRIRTTGRLRRSSVERSESHVQAIQSRGAETVIYELQGYIFFGTANRVMDRLVQDISAPQKVIRNLVIDLRRAQGIDISAGQMFNRLDSECARRAVTLYLCGARTAVRQSLAGAGSGARRRATLDEALVEIEEAVLHDTPASLLAAPLHAPPVAALLQRADSWHEAPLVETLTVSAGETVLERGSPDQALIILEGGQLVATLPAEDGGTMVLARFLPGAIVGEIAFFNGTPRTANIVAETDCQLRRVTREALNRMAQTDPETVIMFQNHLARLLALRLTRTTALVHAYDS